MNEVRQNTAQQLFIFFHFLMHQRKPPHAHANVLQIIIGSLPVVDQQMDVRVVWPLKSCQNSLPFYRTILQLVCKYSNFR